MKTTKIFSILIAAALMIGGCAEEDFRNTTVDTSTPGVHVHLSGAAKSSKTRATVEASDGEKKVNNVLAVLFDTHEGFYKTVEASQVGSTDEYTFIVEKDATYDIYLVANASASLREDLENIPEGTQANDQTAGLEAIVASQEPDAQDNFLMLSKYPERTTTHINESQNIGEVHMERLAARFDILNKAEGVTVNKVTFSNRTMKSSILTRNTMPAQSDWFETKVYDEINLSGDKEIGNSLERKIYTYENYSINGDMTIPTIEIEYSEGDETKTHIVSLTDPSASAGTTLAIKRNNLYRIVLSKATKLEFNVVVSDWETDEDLSIEKLPLILPDDIQEELNSKLLVNRFTEFNVKELDIENKMVTSFQDKNIFLNLEEADPSSYYSSRTLISAGLFSADAVITDSNGEKYRIPSLGELGLLTPTGNGTLEELSYINNTKLCRYPEWYSTSKNMDTSEFEEYIFFSNAADGRYRTPDELNNDPTLGFKGTSQLAMGRITGYMKYASGAVTTGLTEGSGTRVAPIYGIRFKGTDQYAAYKWEYIPVEGQTNICYLNIKIKALPQESKLTVYDITDNHDFWSCGYIEYNFPCCGMLSSSSPNGYRFGEASYFLTTTTAPTTSPINYYVMFSAYYTGISNSSQPFSNMAPLRLIRVEE